MARDHGLEELLREALDAERDLTEKSMFGGRAFLLRGNLLCCARDDGMLIRLGKERDGWALGLPDVKPMINGSRAMPGWIRLGPGAYGDEALLARMIAAALDFVRPMPSK